jgi:hypothetical protein
MNRRGFLGLLAGAAAAGVVGIDLEELLAPARTYFLPPVSTPVATGVIGSYEGVRFIPSLWSAEILRVYKNDLVLASNLNRLIVPRRPVGSYALFDQRAVIYAP